MKLPKPQTATPKLVNPRAESLITPDARRPEGLGFRVFLPPT